MKVQVRGVFLTVCIIGTFNCNHKSESDASKAVNNQNNQSQKSSGLRSSALDADSLLPALDSALEIGLGSNNLDDVVVLMARLAATNPAMALHYICEHGGDFGGGVGIKCLSNILLDYPAEFYQWVNGNGWVGTPLAAMIPIVVGRADPGKGIEIAAGLSGNDRSDFLMAMFASGGKWKEKEILARNLSSEGEKADALMALARTLANSKPTDAFRLLNEINGSGKTNNMEIITLKMIFKTFLWTNPEEGIAALDLTKANHLQAIMGDGELLRRICAIDPAGGRSLLNKLVLTASNEDIFKRYAVESMQADPEGTLDWINRQPYGRSKSGLLIDAFAGLADTKYDLAVKMLDKVSATERLSCLRGIAKAIAVVDFDKSLALARQTPLSQQDDIYREIARASAYQVPANAVRILADPALIQKLGVDFRQEMLDATARTWANQDLQSAQQWVENLPAADAPKGVQGLMSTWMKADPVAASAWLSTQPLGPARDAGAEVLISQIKDTDPEMAAQWRKTLPPETAK